MNANSNQRPTANELLDVLNFGGVLLEVMKIIKKKKILVIKEKKLRPYLKKLIKKYQIFQLHIKKILMLYILVEYLHLAI